MRSADLSVDSAPPVFSAEFEDDLHRLFAWRRDVRHFKREPVSDDVISRLLMETAQTSPSVGLSQPARFVLVETPQARASTVANFEAANKQALTGFCGDKRKLYASLKLNGLNEAPVQVAVFCDETTGQGSGLGAASMPETRRYSVVCAIMQLWLAARAEGLGVGWLSILDPDRLKQDFDIDPGWSLVAYLCIGWPDDHHLDPELERAGWERRRPGEEFISKV